MISFQLSQAYLSHTVYQEIEGMVGLYQHISDSCHSFMVSGTSPIGNYASHIYLSIAGTLDSISLLLKKGRINDATVLCRKYFDDILIDLYMDVKCKSEVDCTFKELFIPDVEDRLYAQYRIPSLKGIIQTLKNSSFTKDLFPFFGWDTYFKKNRQYLDNRVHGNRYRSFLYNCNELYLQDREKHLDNVSILLKQLIGMHLSFLFYLNPYYFVASDYADHVELGYTSPKGSEYWVASFAQDAFDCYIKPCYGKVADFIKEHTFLELN